MGSFRGAFISIFGALNEKMFTEKCELEKLEVKKKRKKKLGQISCFFYITACVEKKRHLE